MGENIENNKRIAKNTALLYIRMFFMMAISLYTSRVILQTLGVKDYGIYNVVGGVVSMFSILSNSLSSSISRFITYEIGRGNYDKLKKVFCTAVNVQLLMSLFVLLLAEIVGVWFLNFKMNISAGRIEAANWVLQCSLFTFCVNLLSIPYNATIIAHEKMSAFAWISIAEAIFKLAIIYLLWISPFDKLKAYAILMLCVSVVVRFIYGYYCKKHFEECSYYFVFDKPLLKEMSCFAGWGFFGNACWMFSTQGVDILINLFFGVTLNAARGVAKQVESAVTQFVTSFMTALNPQITKSYAAGDYDYMHSLICYGSKYSFFLMLIFAIPIGLEAPQILSLWLGVVPDYAIDFVRLSFATSMTTILGNTMLTAVQATGNIKKYQIVVSLWAMLIFPLTWGAYYLGQPPISTYIIYFVIYFILIFVRILVVKDQIRLKMSMFINRVILKVLIVSCASLFLPLLICELQKPTILRLFEVVCVSFSTTVFSIFILGLNNNERDKIISFVKSKI